jgi:predicted extracellular nuclease
VRSNTRSRRGYVSARIKPALFAAVISAAALALTGNNFIDKFVPGLRATAQTNTIVINEIDYDQVGTDTAEFIELKNTGSVAVNIDNYTVEFINAGVTPPAAYGTTVNLPNVNLAPGDYYVICANAATVPNCDLDHTPDTDMIQNGAPDAVALRLSGTIVDTVSYEGTTTGFTEGTGVPTTAADSNTVANIGLSRLPDGTDTNNNSADFSLRCITPGSANVSANASCPTPVAIPNLTVNDVAQNEGDAGTTTFSFTVSLSAPAGAGGVTFDIATADGTAQDDNPTTEDNDYVARSLTGQTIPAGSSTYTFDVTVNGDTLVEPSETFFVNITNVSGAAGVDIQGQGTIQNDDSPNLAINDVSQDEGDAGTTAFTFTVGLSSSTHGGVTFDICTADGTAQDGTPAGEDTDYTANCLTGQTIPNGQNSYQFTVNVNGDTTQEPNETFFVNITNLTGASVTDGQGQGTIVNDDFTITPIHVIQGSTPSGNAASPIVGQVVNTTGIVTLLKTGANTGNGTANGFFLQTPGDDADPNTSQGIFVFTNSVPTVAVGDEVRVTGTVIEFNGLTEIGTVTNVSVIDTGNELPTAVTLDSTILSPTAQHTQPQLEKYEGMRLAAASLRTTAPNDNFYDVYTVLSSVPRPVREPGVPAGDPVPPDPTSGTVDCCIPVFDRNPERLKLDSNGRAGAPNNFYTSNVTFTNVSGPLDYAFGEYRLVPDAGFTASANMSAVPVPTPYATEFTVAGFNIENFNNADAYGPTQRQKAALAIVRVMRLPDIIGHAEIFDLASLQALATEVNTLAVADGHPNPMYEARLIPTPVANIDQNVGFLVKTSRVRIDAVTQERTASTYIRPSDGATDETHDRPPLVLRATVEPSGANKPVIVVVNHTRSFIDIELSTGTGQNVRAKRKAQAEDLADLFNDLQTDNPNVPVIAVGDYNAFQFNNGYDDPVSVLKGSPTADEQIVVDASPDLVNPNFFNLIDNLPMEEQYTFIFNEDKQAQVLDHVLVNTVANDINTRIFVARNNADFPTTPSTAYATDPARPERNSDHDMPVAYFTLFEAAQAGDLLISEFRHFGPGGAEDEFVEIYNNTAVEHMVAATDGSAGYAVATAADQTAGAPRCVIPNGTRIPARGHFLCVNTDGYSLAGHPSGTSRNATADATFTADIPANAGLALFSTANTANFNTDTRLDAAGSASETNLLYKEGGGYPDINTAAARQYSFFRDLRSGTPKDTNDNAADFLYVNTDATDEGAGGRLGAPGPQNLSSPTQRNQIIKASLIDPSCSGVGTAVASTAPGASPDGTPVIGCQNTARDPTPLLVTQPQTSAAGTFYIRRRFRNNTGQNVTRLRFRVVDTTATPQAGTADLRLLTSGAVTYVVGTDPNPVTVQGLTLEEPPAQGLGGGFNSSVQCCTDAPGVIGARTISLAQPLAPNGTIDLQFRFGVMAPGAYRFFVNVEAELQPAATPTASPSKAGAAGSKR